MFDDLSTCSCKYVLIFIDGDGTILFLFFYINHNATNAYAFALTLTPPTGSCSFGTDCTDCGSRSGTALIPGTESCPAQTAISARVCAYRTEEGGNQVLSRVFESDCVCTAAMMFDVYAYGTCMPCGVHGDPATSNLGTMLNADRITRTKFNPNEIERMGRLSGT